MTDVSPRRARSLSDTETAPAEALRAHLIAVTTTLLAQGGLQGLTTRRIAAEAKVADGVLYNYFSDKDDLIVTALRERFGQLARTFIAEVPGPETPFHQGMRTMVDACVGLQAAVIPLAAGLVGRPDLLTRLFQDLHGGGGSEPHTVLTAIIGYVHEHHHQKTSSELDALTTVLLGATGLQALTAHMRARTTDPAELDAVTELLLRGLSGQPPP